MIEIAGFEKKKQNLFDAGILLTQFTTSDLVVT
jgi:hypothetical protein